YLDGEVDPSLRSAMEGHFGQCRRCTAVLEGTRNVVEIFGDERLLGDEGLFGDERIRAPIGYSWRMKRRLASDTKVEQQRRTVLGWLAATAALAVVSGSVLLQHKKVASAIAFRSALAQPGRNVPSNLAVLVNAHGKLFHIAGCPFMNQRDEVRSMVASEAITEGYVPCVRCLGEYVNQVVEKLEKRTPAVV